MRHSLSCAIPLIAVLAAQAGAQSYPHTGVEFLATDIGGALPGYGIEHPVAKARLGERIEARGDFDGDGHEDLLISGKQGEDIVGNGTWAGRTYLIYGPIDQDFTMSSLATFPFATFVGYRSCFYSTTTNARSHGDRATQCAFVDLNGDGADDLVIGAPLYYDPANQPDGDDPGDAHMTHPQPAWPCPQLTASHREESGRVYVIFGGDRITGEHSLETHTTRLPGLNGLVLKADQTHTGLGGWCESADFNNDGFGDLLIRAGSYDAPGVNQFGVGAVAIIYGNASFGKKSLQVPEYSLPSAIANSQISGAWVQGQQLYDYVGTTVSAGDFNGDGLEDVVVGAPNRWVDGLNRGAFYIMYGRTSAQTLTGMYNVGQIGDPNSLGTSIAGTTILGTYPGGDLGYSLAGPGDIDGDGYDDVVVSAINSGYTGDLPDDFRSLVIVLYGGDDLAGVHSAADIGDLETHPLRGAILLGERSGTGRVVGAGGDFNNDGLADFLIGNAHSWGSAPGTTGLRAGRVWLIYGRSGSFAMTGEMALNFTGSPELRGFSISGPHNYAALGTAVGVAPAGLLDLGSARTGIMVAAKVIGGGKGFVILPPN